MKTIEFEIGPDGNTNWIKKGFVGVECKAATTDLEKLFKNLDKKPTPEMLKQEKKIKAESK